MYNQLSTIARLGLHNCFYICANKGVLVKYTYLVPSFGCKTWAHIQQYSCLISLANSREIIPSAVQYVICLKETSCNDCNDLQIC